MRILAIDCGGTRSSAILVDDGGDVISHREFSSGNVYTSGFGAVAERVADVVRQIPGAQALALAAAGVRTNEECQQAIRALRAADVVLPLAVCSDARAALRAAVPHEGVVVISGTGSIALSVERDGTERYVGGWGSIVGDEGSAYCIGRAAIAMAVRRWDESGNEESPLLAGILSHYGIATIEALRAIVSGPDRVRAVASLAPLIAELARRGEPRALQLVDSTVDELERLATLARPRGREKSIPPLVLAGGLFRGAPEITRRLMDRLTGKFEVSLLSIDPAWGAYWLATDRDKWDYGSESEEAPPTERSNPATTGIAALDTAEMLRIMNEQDRLVAPAVGRCIEPIARLVNAAAERMADGGRLIYVGAGTSGRLAVLDAVECVPTFGITPDQVLALLAGGNAALTGAVEGAEDDVDAGTDAVRKARVSPKDVVIGVSASGSAAYVVAALQTARRDGALTAALTCNVNSGMVSQADIVVTVRLGPEVIAGSTRLKAGTAQKLVLNMISTAVMVRLGRTHGNRMVAVSPTNIKLRRRAVSLLQELTGSGEEQALAALEECEWRVAEAALTIRLGDRTAAMAALRASRGNASSALRGAGIVLPEESPAYARGKTEEAASPFYS